MNAIQLLQDQHREVERLFRALEAAGTSPSASEQRYDLFTELADAITAHTTLEERIFYPQVEGDDTELLVRTSYEAHGEMKRLIADLLELSPDDDLFVPKVKMLQEEVDHHVQEEETELFPRVRNDFDAEALERIGVQMQSLLDELMSEGEGAADRRPGIDEGAPLS